MIENETVKSESTAIIDFLQNEGGIDGTSSDDSFLEEI